MNYEYELSGKPGNIYSLGLLAGILLTSIITAAYTLLNMLPFVYVSIIGWVFYLWVLYHSQHWIVHLSKCRSKDHSLTYGMIMGVIALYLNWAFFSYSMFSRNGIECTLFGLLINPGTMLDVMQFVSNAGYEVGSLTFNDGPLVICWLIEAGGILAVCAYGGSKATHKKVFCEDCNNWTDKIDIYSRRQCPNSEELDKILWEDLSGLIVLPVATPDDPYHLKLNPSICYRCNNLHTLDLNLIYYEHDHKGELKEKTEDIGPVYKIDDQLAQQIIKLN